MTELFGLIINGFMTGCIYSIIGMGIVVVYKASGVFNFAQGQFVLAGAYILGSLLVNFAMPLWACFLITFFVSGLLGMLCERLFMRPLIGQPVLSLILMTMALGMLLLGLITLIWGGTFIIYPKIVPSEVIKISNNFEVSSHLFIAFLISILTLITFFFFFQYTRIGLSMRGTSEDHQLAQSMGINVRSVFTNVWILSALLASISGIMIGSLMGVHASLGTIGLKAFPVVILGGLDSVLGVMIAGPIVGILDNLVSGYLDPLVAGEMKQVVPFIILLIVLLFKPEGLFGLKRIERL